MSENNLSLIPDNIWKLAVSVLMGKISSPEMRNKAERHFSMFLTHDFDGKTLSITVQEEIQADMFAPEYSGLLKESFGEIGFNDIDVRFLVSAEKPESFSVGMEAFSRHPQSNANANLPAARYVSSMMPLHEDYTFENFVEGPSNSFALAAASAVSKNPGISNYNPLFIYGGTGLGKTHLMEAIGHRVLQNNPSCSVCYITAETFMNEYVNAIKNNSMPAFRNRYRKVDLLLLDDVQFIASTEKFQEEFFYTFNDLMLDRKQVVMTSDVAPRDMKGCEERITGRFQQGMVVEIESPSYETRLAILKFKSQSSGKIIPEEIFKYIAENIRSHVRALDGALKRVVTFLELNPGLPLSIEIVQHLLKDQIEEEKTIKDLTIDNIMKLVASSYGITIKEIISQNRTQTLVTPRQVAMFLSRKLTTNSLKEIADAFNKSHATVHHGMQQIQKRLDVEEDLRKTVENLTSQLGRKPSELLK